MNKAIKYISIFSLGLAITACEPEIDGVPVPTSGKADFSTYVALGNSLTAGYANNALYRKAQINSYPAILAMQFAKVGGGPFTQPLVPEGNGSNLSGFGKLKLTLIAGSPFPIPTPGDPDVFNSVSDGGPYNNLGVPGAKAAHLTAPGYGSDQGNPFFARFASSPITTIVADAVAQNPTFFTLWIGNNDVLDYATSGGERGEITDPLAFKDAINDIIAALQQSNPEIGGAIANIPDVAKIPYFNVVPWNAFVLESEEQVALLTAAFAAQIDPAVKEKVDSAVIMTVVTEKVVRGAVTQAVIKQAVTMEAVNTQIIPQVAREIVKMQIAASAPCNTESDPAACAEGVIRSGATNETIDALEERLQTNYFLPADDRDQELNNAYLAIDQALALPETQEQIQIAYERIWVAYGAGELPEEQAILITAAIEENYSPTLEGFLAGSLPAEQQAQIQAVIDAIFEPTFDAFRAGLLPLDQQELLAAATDSIFNAQIAQLKAAGFYPVFEVGPNGFVVEVDKDVSPTGIKQLTENEKMLLPFLAVSGEVINPSEGLVVVPDQYALVTHELTNIETARTAYNATLKTTATSNGFAYVDFASFLDNVASDPLLMAGKVYSTTFVTGNIFSLDGVHLTPAGYAIVANQFIEAINTTYGSSVPPVGNINQYETVALP